MKGTVIKSTGSWYQVRTSEGAIIPCRLKGKIRLAGIRHTNPITVGDHVSFEYETDPTTGVIYEIDERRNYIIRKASNLSKDTHILASNLDQAVLIATLASPVTSRGFIDRFLVTAEAYHIPAFIIFNKADLLTTPDQLDTLHSIRSVYETIGYPCLVTSVMSSLGLNDFSQLLRNKVSLVTGHSGVGKSSLLNAIDPKLNLRTGEVSQFHQKGQHTTTFAEMVELSEGGYIIDTPGIREFGVVDIPDEELSHYFRDMRPLIGSCKFNNCKHLNEPGCAIRKAVSDERIDAERYRSYLSILANEDLYH